MSCDVALAGTITVDPPLTANDLAMHPALVNLPWLPTQHAHGPVQLVAAVLPTSTAARVDMEAARIEPTSSDCFATPEEITAAVQAVVDAFPDRTYSGSLIWRGEQQGDIRRFLVRDGQTVTEEVAITWPDGTPYDPEEGYARPDWLADLLGGRQ